MHAGFGRLILCFWSSTQLGLHHSNLDSLGSPSDHFPSLIMLWMDSLLWISFSLSLWLTSTKPPTYWLTVQSRLLGSMQVPGWSLMSYPQSHLNLLRRFHLNRSSLMAYSTCFAFGVSEELVLYSPGTDIFPVVNSVLRIFCLLLGTHPASFLQTDWRKIGTTIIFGFDAVNLFL